MRGVLKRIAEAAESLGWLATMLLVFAPALLVVDGFFRQEERR